MELSLHHYVQRTQAEHLLQQVLIEREYQQAYIDSLKEIPTFKSASFNSLTIKRFIDHYPDFFPVFKEKVGRNFSFYMSEKVKNNEYILRCADKFLDEKRDKLIDFFWNIDLGKIFCLSSSDIIALSFQNTKTMNYTKISKVIEPKLNSQILQLFKSQILQLYSQKKITIQKTSMSYFLMNCFTQPYYNAKTKEKIFLMISRRVKSKFFLNNKLSWIGQQYLSKGSKFNEPKFYGQIRYTIENHYINFMPFLQALSSNRIDIILFNDFKWFSKIIQITQTTSSLGLEKTEKILDPELAKLVENIKSILFFESKDICFKFSMFFVVYYAQNLLLEKNRGCMYGLIHYIFKDNPEIPEIIHYIMTDNKIETLETLQETKHDYYQIIKAYGKKFCYIAGCLTDFYDGNYDLQISQLFDEGVMSNNASPLQKIVFYILKN